MCSRIVCEAAEAMNRSAIKEELITDMYKTGRLDGLYFGKTSRSKENPIKLYIKACLYKSRITFDADLVDDCYNEAFMHLWAMPASKICDMYDTSPKKLQATTLMIISLKCFAIDPRYSNPKHSMVQGILFASSFSGSSFIDSSEEYNDTYDSIYMTDSMRNHKVIIRSHEAECDFTADYGFSPEDILDIMTECQREQFYNILGKQPRGKQSTSKKLARSLLDRDINNLKSAMSKAG